MELVPNVKTYPSSKPVYKNTKGYYTHAAGKYVKLGKTSVINKKGETIQLKYINHVLLPNVKTHYSNKPIYVNKGKYFFGGFTTGKIYVLSKEANLKKPNGSIVKLKNIITPAAAPVAPVAAAATIMHKGSKYNITNLKTVNNYPIYKKNKVSTYYSKHPQLGLKKLSVTTLVKKNGIANNLKKWISAPAPAPAPAPAHNETKFNITNLKTVNNHPVYKKKGVSTYYAKKPTGFTKLLVSTMLKKNGSTKQLKQWFPKVPAAAPAAPAAAPAAVLAVSLVPIIVPGPDHVAEKHSVHEASLQKVADKIKKITEIFNDKNNTSNYENYKKARGQMPFAHMNRTNTVEYKATTVVGFHGGGDWRSSLSVPKFEYFTTQVSMKYSQYLAHYQLLLQYGRNVNSFQNVHMSDIIDLKWLIAQDKYIRTLSSRQLFTMYGYSHNGDSWAHAYLDKRFELSKFKSALSALGNNFFAFFFQARDYYKVNTGDINADYTVVLSLVRNEQNVENLHNIMNMFINELNNIIRKAPPVTKTFIIFRGQQDDKYMSGVLDNTYTTERFCSCSVNAEVSRLTFAKGHTLQRISVLSGSKCLLMFGATRYAGETEILLPRGATYKIVKKRNNVSKPSGLLNVYAAPLIQNLVDIVLVGTVEDNAPNESVTIQVPVEKNTNTIQRYVNKNTTVLQMVGKGGSGVVYMGTNKKNGNVAIKIQKNGNNAALNIAALKKLNGKGVAPTLYSYKSNHFANNQLVKIVPKLKVGNRVSVMKTQLIRGNPLRKWYTGTPVPQEIKNKVKNSIAKMHAAGIIHGNLHRNNIIIGNNGKAYIIDFGKSLITNKKFNNANKYLNSIAVSKNMKGGKQVIYSTANKYHVPNGTFLSSIQ
jgi:predicted Ser/Thr protein kinase